MKNQRANILIIRLISLFLVGIVTVAATIPNLPDPTRPPDTLIPAARKLKIGGALQLNATFIYPDHRFAMINGRMVNLGDMIGEYTIINIQHDTVELKGSKDTSMVLTLFPKVKTPTAEKG